MLTQHPDAGKILVSGLTIGGKSMLWFLIKYWVVSTLLVVAVVYLGLDWWQEDSRRVLLLIVCQSASFGMATVSYLEKGDWLRWRK